MKNANLLVIAVTILIAAACKKDKSATGPTRTQLISSQSWKYDKATVAGMDIGAQIPDCYKDNLITLKDDKTGLIEEGTNICSPSTAANFTWRFSANEDSLVLSVPIIAGFSGAFKIDTLTATQLKLSQTINVPPLNLPAPAVLQLKR